MWETRLGNVIFLLVAFVFLLGLVVALGLGVGQLVHWLLPSIELGMAMLLGTVMSGLAIHLFLGLLRSFTDFQVFTAMDEADEQEEQAEPKPTRKRRRNS